MKTSTASWIGVIVMVIVYLFGLALMCLGVVVAMNWSFKIGDKVFTKLDSGSVGNWTGRAGATSIHRP